MNDHYPQIFDKVAKKEYSLTKKIVKIGSSPSCDIRLEDNKIPKFCGHILFERGSYHLAGFDTKCKFFVNNILVEHDHVLTENDTISIGNHLLIFHNKSMVSDTISDTVSPLNRFIKALSILLTTSTSDVRFELLLSISSLLECDGAQLVVEDENGEFKTIAHYPQQSPLDRFSRRALTWAREHRKTILMHDTDWTELDSSTKSLELNKIGSLLVTPICQGETVKGFLYCDRLSVSHPFSENDRNVLDTVNPIFATILAIHERTQRQAQTIEHLQQNNGTDHFSIIHSSEVIKKTLRLAHSYAQTESTVLINGETGVGKELFAHFIHDQSMRKDGSFCAINCGAIPENLIESELFGHQKGAFTGAVAPRKGLFERAHGGTVFLDEIGELPLHLQVKLLRVLQESEFVPVGGDKPQSTDVRIIAATNVDLAEEVVKKTFRQDLFYRLNVLHIVIPPLRARDRDVSVLADYFIKKYAARFGLSEKTISLGAQGKLLTYTWPGNVRELENCIQKALVTSSGALITEDDIQLGNKAISDSAYTHSNAEKFPEKLKDARVLIEKLTIINALRKSSGNVTVASKILDVDRKWVTKLMKLYQIDNTEFLKK